MNCSKILWIKLLPIETMVDLAEKRKKNEKEKIEA
jgi:hypothetical protein